MSPDPTGVRTFSVKHSEERVSRLDSRGRKSASARVNWFKSRFENDPITKIFNNQRYYDKQHETRVTRFIK